MIFYLSFAREKKTRSKNKVSMCERINVVVYNDDSANSDNSRNSRAGNRWEE